MGNCIYFHLKSLNIFQYLKQLHHLTASPSSETMTDATVKEVRGIKQWEIFLCYFLTQNTVVLHDQKDKKWRRGNSEMQSSPQTSNIDWLFPVTLNLLTSMLSFCFHPFNQKAILMQVCDISVNILMWFSNRLETSRSKTFCVYALTQYRITRKVYFI